MINDFRSLYLLKPEIYFLISANILLISCISNFISIKNFFSIIRHNTLVNVKDSFFITRSTFIIIFSVNLFKNTLLVSSIDELIPTTNINHIKWSDLTLCLCPSHRLKFLFSMEYYNPWMKFVTHLKLTNFEHFPTIPSSINLCNNLKYFYASILEKMLSWWT